MPLLNNADTVYVGSTKADKVYLGTTQVWTGALPSVTVGENPLPFGGSNISSQVLCVTKANPAPRNGTLTQATIKTSSASSGYILTGGIVSGSFLVTGRQSVNFGLGSGDYPVSVPMNSGDYLAVYLNSSDLKINNTGGAGYYFSVGGAAPPDVGGTRSVTSASGVFLYLQGILS